MTAPNIQVQHRVHTDMSFAVYQETLIDQTAGPEVIFRPAYMPPPPGVDTCTIPLCAIGYMGTGIVAHGNGFTLDDSFRKTLDGLSPTERARFLDKGVVGDDVEVYHLSCTRHVAYNAMQHQYYRARTPELFRNPSKLLVGKTSGGYYDDQSIFANHSAHVVVPWYVLERVDEKGVNKVRHQSEQKSAYTSLHIISTRFDLRYVLAIMNSDYMRRYLLASKARGTRAEIYPDDWKLMPVKVISAANQARIAALVDTIQQEYIKLAALPDDAAVCHEWQRQGRLTSYLKDYFVAGDIQTVGALDRTKRDRFEIAGDKLFLYGATGIQATHIAAMPILEYVSWYCNEINTSLRGRSWNDLRATLPMPTTVSDIATLYGEVDAARGQREAQRQAIAATQKQIENQVVNAFRNGCDAALWTEIQTYRLATMAPLPSAEAIDDDADDDMNDL